jgi:hypothetical protein
MKLTLVQRKDDRDMVDVYRTDQGKNHVAAVMHIDAFHQDDRSVYDAIMTGRDVQVKLELVEE